MSSMQSCRMPWHAGDQLMNVKSRTMPLSRPLMSVPMPLVWGFTSATWMRTPVEDEVQVPQPENAMPDTAGQVLSTAALTQPFSVA